ncbi:hypothetical protein ACS0TY_022779 [Phlomoides rotata]
MDKSHHHNRRIKLHLTTITTVALLLLLSPVSSFTFNPTQFRSGVRKMKEERVGARRRLGGLGSSPPTCRSKCGRCGPCVPVHVTIQPGFAMKLEYYPEAWRCKCRNRLFMP